MKKVFIVMIALCLGLAGVVPAGPLDGKLLYEHWDAIGGVNVTDLTGNARYPASPSGSFYLTSFDGPLDWKENFGGRITGYIIPPQTGLYNFWIASDDGGELWLSKSSSPAGIAKISWVTLWANHNDWSDADVTPSAAIPLTANMKYYVMALYKEGGGGDNCSVAWSGPGIGARTLIGGAYISADRYPVWKATGPVAPANGAIDVPLGTVKLKWAAPSITPPGPIKWYNVYFGTDAAVMLDPNAPGAYAVRVAGGTLEADVAVSTKDETYYWRVDTLLADNANDPNTALGAIWSFGSERTLPIIQSQPQSLRVYPLETAVLSVDAVASDPLMPIATYQWYDAAGALANGARASGAVISGATTDTLAIAGATDAEAADYYCIVSTVVGGSTRSNNAHLYIKHLVAHYEFEEMGSFDGAAVVKDSAPFNGYNDGVVHYSANPAAMLVDGVIGKAIRFNGVNENVVAGSVGISGNVPRTIACWVKAEVLDIPNWTNIFGFSTRLGGVTDRSFDFDRRGGQNTYCLHVYGWERNMRTINFDWHHLVGTYDGNNTLRWYVDGVEAAAGVNGADASGQARGPLQTEDNVVMAKRGHEWKFFKGAIDDARIYDFAMDAREAAAIYVLGAPDAQVCMPPVGDLNGDCSVDIDDLAIVVSQWLDCNLVPDCKP